MHLFPAIHTFVRGNTWVKQFLALAGNYMDWQGSVVMICWVGAGFHNMIQEDSILQT